jgi:hypothetical protein
MKCEVKKIKNEQKLPMNCWHVKKTVTLPILGSIIKGKG